MITITISYSTYQQSYLKSVFVSNNKPKDGFIRYDNYIEWKMLPTTKTHTMYYTKCNVDYTTPSFDMCCTWIWISWNKHIPRHTPLWTYKTLHNVTTLLYQIFSPNRFFKIYTHCKTVNAKFKKLIKSKWPNLFLFSRKQMLSPQTMDKKFAFCRRYQTSLLQF